MSILKTTMTPMQERNHRANIADRHEYNLTIHTEPSQGQLGFGEFQPQQVDHKSPSCLGSGCSLRTSECHHRNQHLLVTEAFGRAHLPNKVFTESCQGGTRRSLTRKSKHVTSTSTKDLTTSRMDKRIGFESCSTTTRGQPEGEVVRTKFFQSTNQLQFQFVMDQGDLTT